VRDDRDILCVRAPNPGPLTLSGTNTWLVGRGPTWVVDPGPAIAAHIECVLAQIDARGGLAGVALTHGHSDHAGAVAELLERCPAPLDQLVTMAVELATMERILRALMDANDEEIARRLPSSRS